MRYKVGDVFIHKYDTSYFMVIKRLINNWAVVVDNSDYNNKEFELYISTIEDCYYTIPDNDLNKILFGVEK